MIGIALVALGGVLLWAAMTGKGANVLTALKADISTIPPPAANPSTAPTATTGSSSNPNAFNPANPVAAYMPGPGGLGGTFTGQSGAQYHGSYASLTPAQRDDVNAFANHGSNPNA